MHIQELVRLNADITPKTRVAVVRGQKGGLTGAPVMATDLRASACLVLVQQVRRDYQTTKNMYVPMGCSMYNMVVDFVQVCSLTNNSGVALRQQ